jgi:hypothetical protein
VTRARVLLALLLAAVLVGAGSTAAWAIWSATGTTGSAVTIGKIAGSIAGTNAMTTTFSSSNTSTTNPLTLTNSGSVAGTTSTSVSVVSGSSAALAGAVAVSAWPAASTSACTASAAVGTGAVTGTWASLPSMSSSLAAGASAVWCVRSTPTSSAPPSSTANVTIDLTIAAGTWRSTAARGGFYLNTASSASPAATCVDHGGNYIDVKWDASARSLDTWYGAFLNRTMVGAKEQGYTASIQVSSSQVPTTLAADGPATIDVTVLDGSGNATTTVVASAAVTLFVQNGTRAIRCGS